LILVTGNAGFVGRHLTPLLGDNVVGLDRLEGSDLTDSAIPSRVGIQDVNQVYHLAAEHFVPWCRLHPTETLATNVGGLLNLLAGLDRHPPVTFVFTSSAAVYGFHSDTRSESDAPRPADVYGWSKLIGELALADFSQRHPDTTVVCARLSNVIGPDDGNPHIVPALLEARRKGEPARVGTVWPTRDYVNVDDVAVALVRLAELPRGYHVYNVGTGRATSITELAAALGVPLEPDPAKERASDGHLVLDVSKIAKQLGWKAKRPLAAVLEEVRA